MAGFLSGRKIEEDPRFWWRGHHVVRRARGPRCELGARRYDHLLQRWLWRVPDSGGTAEELTVPAGDKREQSHQHPYVLPNGEWVLFSVFHDRPDKTTIEALSLVTDERKVVHRGGNFPRYSPTGHLVFMQEDTLMAAHFDVDRSELTGSPVSIIEDIWSNNVGGAQFNFSQTGMLVHSPGGGVHYAARRSLVLVDRKGNEQDLPVEPRSYWSPRVSPDGSRLALDILPQGGDKFDVWVYDLDRKTRTRLTSDPAHDLAPRWTPDGKRVVFSSDRDGKTNLYWKAADGTGSVERLTKSLNSQYPVSFAPNGKELFFTENNPKTRQDIGVVSLKGGPTSKFLIQTEFVEYGAELSPDGRWLAYLSNETGRPEVYVRPYPQLEDGKWMVTSEGAFFTFWGPDGRELFYINRDGVVMVVPVQTEPRFKLGNPQVMVTPGYYTEPPARHCDIFPDGQRFLMMKEVEITRQASELQEIIIVVNWFDELKRLVPTDQ